MNNHLIAAIICLVASFAVAFLLYLDPKNDFEAGKPDSYMVPIALFVVGIAILILS